jgi:nucleotide-binding universal stress UspA family protein
VTTNVGEGRVVVGVDGSPQSVAALRAAVEQARCRGSRLCIVNARQPSNERDPFLRYADAQLSAFSDLTEIARTRWLENETHLHAQAQGFLRHIVESTFGFMPDGIAIDTIVRIGDPARVLVEQAWRKSDLLVVGTHGGHRWRHPTRRSVSRYCVKRAVCPVLVVRTAQVPASVPYPRL